MPNPESDPKQPAEATSAHAGWLTRAQVAAELGYRSIYPIRKMEGQTLHPAREARGWVFDPAEVAALKTKRMVAASAAPPSEGRLAARVFYLFDHGRELREIVQELGGRSGRRPRPVARVAHRPRRGRDGPEQDRHGRTETASRREGAA